VRGRARAGDPTRSRLRARAGAPFTKDTVFTLGSPQSRYWIYVPSSYDASHATPVTLLIWSHGCGGQSSGDVYTVSPGGDQSYISIAVDGREGDCWNPDTDQAKLLAAIADVESHFRIDRHRVILGGYSSGGDLSYRLAFYHSRMFAGALAENTSPFRDTGSSESASLAAGTFKFHVVHLAHTEDEAYPIAGVRRRPTRWPRASRSRESNGPAPTTTMTRTPRGRTTTSGRSCFRTSTTVGARRKQAQFEEIILGITSVAEHAGRLETSA